MKTDIIAKIIIEYRLIKPWTNENRVLLIVKRTGEQMEYQSLESRPPRPSVALH